MPKRSKRVRRRILAGFCAASAVLTAGYAWALTQDTWGLRHETASSLRAAMGPPSPIEIEATPWVLIPEAEASPSPPPPQRPADLRGVSFVLLLGTDNRRANAVGRTDAMILAAFRHADGAIAALSLPRDLWVELPDVGTLHAEGRDHARLGSVVRVGELRLGAGEGMALLRETLDLNLGLRFDRHASIDFAGFAALVDELGGIEVEVACPIKDCFWIDGPDQPCVTMEVDAGSVEMDGATALAFVRSRHGTGDRDRRRRQQAVMLGFAHELRARGLRGIHGLWRKAEPHLRGDLASRDAIYYGSFALETPLSEVRGFSIKHPLTARHVTQDGKHVLLLERDLFEQALQRLFEAKLPALRERKRCPDPEAALARPSRAPAIGSR